MLAAAQHHHLRHRRGQRQHQAEAGTSPGRTGGLDPASDGVDFGADHVHADAAAGQVGELLGRGQAAVKDQRGQGLFAGLVVGGDQTGGDGALAQPRQVQASAIVAHLHRHLVAGLGQGDGDRAGRVLAFGLTLRRRLDAVDHAVAQQVLESHGHALEHAPVDFNRAADDVQPHLLGAFFGGLAHHPVQAVRQAFELDHPGAQQVGLHVAGQPRLLGQFVFGDLQIALQAALQRRHVGHRFSHRAGDFLEPGKAVHLQRVELQGGGTRGLLAGADLHLGL